jgi:arabinofuranan 3-O-arabinosyltransferase
MTRALEQRYEAHTDDVWRVRHIVVALGLVALAFVQQPGRVLNDTKLDLVVDPGAFLERAAHLWDPTGAFGQVQNQSYGYFFPMGPFFWLGDAVGLDPWVTQRLWWALILVTGFLGVVKLCQVLPLGSPWTRVVAGLAFALSPRILTTLGPISIEAWPSAVAPWVLVPLVIGARRGSPVKAAALSALAVACVGGVNAAATAAVLPLGALWLLTLAPGARRRRMMLWWPALVLVATAWWLLPLLVLGQYSPPFLDYIESAQVTTFPATAIDALRGTTNWVPYVSGESIAGRQLISNAAIIANSVVLVGLGLVGLGQRSNPHRSWLALGVCAGLVLVTLGHLGSPEGLFSTTVHGWLDGVLAPLRNTHKFDVAIRLPLVLGLAHVLGHLLERRRDVAEHAVPAWGATVLAGAALLGATVPAWTMSLPSTGHFAEVPDYWERTAQWLADNDDGRRALLVPGSPFGSYLWGAPRDEPLQPLAESNWAVRNAIPLAPGGNIAMLDAIEARIASGEGSPGLADALRRAGVGYLVVRNDLSRSAGAPDPVLVHAAIESSSGLERVRSFGPPVGGSPVLRRGGSRAFVNGGWQDLRPAVEIYRVQPLGGDGVVRAQQWTGLPTVVGGQESLIALDDLGILDGESVLLPEDVPAAGPPASLIVTDGRRRQEVAFGRTHGNRSASLGARDEYVGSRPTHEYDDGAEGRWLTVPRLIGAERIHASSAQSDVDAFGAIDQAAQPWSAFDSDPLTAWSSGSEAFVGGRRQRPWIQIDLAQETVVEEVELVLADSEAEARQVLVSTDRGSVDALPLPGEPTRVSLPEGATRMVRVTAGPAGPATLSLAEVQLDGIGLGRPLVLPATPQSWGAPDRLVLTADAAYRDGCASLQQLRRCRSGADRWGEDGRTLDRVLTVNDGGSWSMALTAQAFGGPALDRELQRDRLAVASVSSHLVRAPEVGAVSAVDADADSAWIADVADEDPTITLTWLGQRRVTGLDLELSPSIAASPATRVEVDLPGDRERRGRVRDGQVRFRSPVRTDSMEVHLRTEAPVGDIAIDGGATVLPIGISEINPSGTSLFGRPLDTVRATRACGSGPATWVDGTLHESALVASEADLVAGDVVDAVPCESRAVRLDAGERRLTVEGTDHVRPVSVVLSADTRTRVPASVTEAPAVTRWGDVSRSVAAGDPDGDLVVSVAENANEGWRADGPQGRLQAVRLNGWQQGWLVPAGPREQVVLWYAPDGVYRGGLLGGGLALLLLAVGTLLLGRRRDRTPTMPALNVARGAAWPGSALAAAALLVAGPLGLVAAGLGLGSAVGLRRWIGDRAAWSTLGFWMLAGAFAVLRPWGADGEWSGEGALAQLLALASLGAAIGAGLDAIRLPQRIAGRSTTR